MYDKKYYVDILEKDLKHIESELDEEIEIKKILKKILKMDNNNISKLEEYKNRIQREIFEVKENDYNIFNASMHSVFNKMDKVLSVNENGKEIDMYDENGNKSVAIIEFRGMINRRMNSLQNEFPIYKHFKITDVDSIDKLKICIDTIEKIDWHPVDESHKQNLEEQLKNNSNFCWHPVEQNFELYDIESESNRGTIKYYNDIGFQNDDVNFPEKYFDSLIELSVDELKNSSLQDLNLFYKHQLLKEFLNDSSCDDLENEEIEKKFESFLKEIDLKKEDVDLISIYPGGIAGIEDEFDM